MTLSISNRSKKVPQSPIRKLMPYAYEAMEQGKKIYHLNIGQPDIETPPLAMKKLHDYSQTIIAYGDSAGNMSYREKLSKHYKEIGIDVSPEEILITTGGSEAILFIMLTCFNPGDEVIIPEPFYANYLSFAEISGIKTVPMTSYIEDDFALPPVSEIEKIITPKTKGILICNPNNPTGYIYSKEELEQLRQLVLKHELYLISDEVYKEFCFTDEPHSSVLELEGLEQHAIMIDSVSKRYSSCGARVGNITTKNKDVISSLLLLGQARLCPPMLGQVVAEAALEENEEYLNIVFCEYKARRDYLVNALNKIDGVKAIMPRGTFYAMVELPVEDAEVFCIWMLKDFEYNGATVMMAPATGFYFTEGLGKNQIRIAFVLNTTALSKAVECLEKGLQKYLKTH